ncbi:MAG TPA: EAL domain-containing protein [Thermomicrobiales bacterium]|nr:EAL domain-containing protein [Thermomicrobiales bacterium]
MPRHLPGEYSTRVRVALVVGVTFAYALAFVPLAGVAGGGAAALAALPVMVAAAAFGARAGLAAGLLALPLNTLLLNLAGHPGWLVVLHDGGGPGSAVLPVLGGVIGWLRDLSRAVAAREAARERAEEALRRSERRFRSLVQNCLDVITVLDATGAIRYESPSVERVLGHRPADLLGTNILALVAPEDRGWIAERLARVAATPGVHEPLEVRVRHKDGSTRCVEAVPYNLLGDPSVGGIVVNSRDITEQKALVERLTYQAFHDPLTGLPNRALFLDRLGHAVSRAERGQAPVAVLLLDLDRFKVINDSLGHESGDQLLSEMAERLRACLRPGDTVARLGGDEFTILLEDLPDAERPRRVAERILERLRQPLHLGGHEVFVTASIGIALGATDQEAPEDLLRNADIAMYRAKAEGKAHYEIFDPSMNARALERLDLEHALWRAIARGEFRIHYQPIARLDTARIVGAEALVRWQHPERGLVPPAEFIPLAEETGLIVPLGRWVLREACRQARQWQEAQPHQPPLAISVNLSARQLQQPGLVDDIAAALRETGLAPEHLQIEITEHVVMGNAPAMVSRLRRLKDLGLRLAIDDFGTGYSSLSYLKRFPVDTLKIDKAFVGDLGAGEDAAIVEAVLSLAHALGLAVTAEGAETAGALARLRALGCDLAQGYQIARPLPPADFAAFLAGHAASAPDALLAPPRDLASSPWAGVPSLAPDDE